MEIFSKKLWLAELINFNEDTDRVEFIGKYDDYSTTTFVHW